MRFLQLRPAAILTSLAILAAAAGTAPVALAQSGGPTVVLSSSTASTTNASSIPVTVTFSEAVTGFSLSGIQATNATASGLTGTTTTYSFTLTPTSDGTVTVTVNADSATATAPPNKGNQVSNTLTFNVDRTAPTIGTIVATPTTNSATITWTTNEPATGQVAYGTTTGYGSQSTLNPSLTTTHTATISGLATSTMYHFQITSADGLGNSATSSDQTFTTLAATSTPGAPVITNVSAAVTGTSTATITWNTDVPSTSQVFYGTTTSYGSSSTLSVATSTSHSVSLTGLHEATLYHYQVVSTGVGGSASSTDATFTTNSTASSTPLALNGVDPVNTTATADGTYDHGFSWILHFIVPTNETTFQMKFADFTNASSSGTIPIANNVRYFSPQASNASSTATAITETNNDYGGALNLTGDTSSTTPGRQIDVTVQVAVPIGTPTGTYSTTFGARSTP